MDKASLCQLLGAHQHRFQAALAKLAHLKVTILPERRNLERPSRLTEEAFGLIARV